MGYKIAAHRNKMVRFHIAENNAINAPRHAATFV